MPKGVPKSGVNTGWFQKGNSHVVTPEMRRNLSERMTGRTVSEETKRRLSESLKSSPAAQAATAKLNARKRGVPLSAEHRRKIGLAGFGKQCSPETRRKIGAAHRKKVVSAESRLKMSRAKKGVPTLSGPQHYNWKGGVTSLKSRLWQSGKYQEWRTAIFMQDNYTCVFCAQHGGYLEADHITPFAVLRRQYACSTLEQCLACPALWRLENGQTLCRSCHRKKTRQDMRLIRSLGI